MHTGIVNIMLQNFTNNQLIDNIKRIQIVQLIFIDRKRKFFIFHYLNYINIKYIIYILCISFS